MLYRFRIPTISDHPSALSLHVTIAVWTGDTTDRFAQSLLSHVCGSLTLLQAGCWAQAPGVTGSSDSSRLWKSLIWKAKAPSSRLPITRDQYISALPFPNPRLWSLTSLPLFGVYDPRFLENHLFHPYSTGDTTRWPVWGPTYKLGWNNDLRMLCLDHQRCRWICQGGYF